MSYAEAYRRVYWAKLILERAFRQPDNRKVVYRK
jgi:hypothetical protein